MHHRPSTLILRDRDRDRDGERASDEVERDGERGRGRGRGIGGHSGSERGLRETMYPKPQTSNLTPNPNPS
eukprot:284366-Rhodomonas_salina.1